MSVEPLESCIEIITAHGASSAAFRDYFSGAKHALLDDPSVAAFLISEICRSGGEDVNTSTLFELLLDDARIRCEDDDARGPAFLESVEKILTTSLEAHAFEQTDLIMFAVMYQRAGLSVPDFLRIDPDTFVPPADIDDEDLNAQLEEFAKAMREEGGDTHDLFNELTEMMAGMPEEMQANFANHMPSLADPAFERCALYFLCANAPLIQEAAAAGLLERFNRSGLQPSTLLFQPIVRGWLPDGTARELVDTLGQQALKQARQNERAAENNGRKKIVIHKVFASIADGAGAQSLSVVAKQGRKVCVGNVLTKTGYGIKDAFVLRCRSMREAENIFTQMGLQIDGAEIGMPTLEMLIEAALADGIENGTMPAPGLLDVMENCDLFKLRPQAKSLPELLAFVDATREIRDATPQKLSSWITDDAVLDDLLLLIDSWFEDSTETRQIAERSRSADSMAPKLWKYLDDRRDIWARRFLQTAAMLKDAKSPEEWQLLSASAMALMNGQPLKSIPLMEQIVFATSEASIERL